MNNNIIEVRNDIKATAIGSFFVYGIPKVSFGKMASSEKNEMFVGTCNLATIVKALNDLIDSKAEKFTYINIQVLCNY